eukprot:TRINITY_DN1709_c0_g1_i1.p1 TRINITY_DN1709_c0_g1~~TRINITY_DN1709_c0_g1_i1.p1  ORF type:complete len:207 (+),score=46.51 TRINITY_DN1709_c0_g1_i1:58-678(+)
MSILEYNGGAVVAMVGKDCVGIASDLRFGIQAQTISGTQPKIYKIHDKCLIGLAGLATDNQTVFEKIRFRTNIYRLKEEREIRPKTLSNVLSMMLYEKRFGPYFVEPVIMGLDGPDEKPFISAMDLIGAPLLAEDFVLAGSSASEALYGVCESLYRPNLEADELFEVLGQCILSAVDRDAISGWGGVVHIMTKEGITSRYLKGRQD